MSGKNTMTKIKIEELKMILEECDLIQFNTLKLNLKNDLRINIQSLLEKKQRQYNKEAKAQEEYNLRKIYENKLLRDNFNFIAGIDEVGRGPLAGPVYTAAVIMDLNNDVIGIRDSKKLTKEQREYLSEEIKQKCICYSIGIASEEEIDCINILNATKLAMKRALNGLKIKPDYILIDALKLEDVDIPQISIIKGDDLSISIGAASIIAKVARDKFMDEVSMKYPGYYFEKNKGYGTQEHIEAIRKYGPCLIHRKSFIKNFI
jgi:ribonuclease HII